MRLRSEVAAAAEKKVESARATLDRFPHTVADYEAALTTAREYGEAVSRHEAAAAKLDAAEKRRDALNGTQPEPADEAALATARNDFQQVQETAARLEESALAIEREMRTIGRDIHAVSDELKDAERRRAARDEVLESQATRRYVVAMLDEFTTCFTLEKLGIIADAVNMLLPLSGLQGFERFELDHTFTPRVEVEGVSRRTADLSGGEKATLGMLMRLGIVAAMNGGVLDSTIIADEPLAALDEQARSRVVGILSKLPCPIVIISHTPEAEEVAEKRVHVTKEAGRSTIAVL